jgi:hypothetical protein
MLHLLQPCEGQAYCSGVTVRGAAARKAVVPTAGATKCFATTPASRIAYWLEAKSADTLLIAATDGTLTWGDNISSGLQRAGHK